MWYWIDIFNSTSHSLEWLYCGQETISRRSTMMFSVIQILTHKTAYVKQTRIVIDHICNSLKSKTLFLREHKRKPIDVYITWVWSTDHVILMLSSSFFGKFLWSLQATSDTHYILILFACMHHWTQYTYCISMISKMDCYFRMYWKQGVLYITDKTACQALTFVDTLMECMTVNNMSQICTDTIRIATSNMSCAHLD